MLSNTSLQSWALAVLGESDPEQGSSGLSGLGFGF